MTNNMTNETQISNMFCRNLLVSSLYTKDFCFHEKL